MFKLCCCWVESINFSLLVSGFFPKKENTPELLLLEEESESEESESDSLDESEEEESDEDEEDEEDEEEESEDSTSCF